MENRLGNAMVMISMFASMAITCAIATACSSSTGAGGAAADVGYGPLEGQIVAATPVTSNAYDGGTADVPPAEVDRLRVSAFHAIQGTIRAPARSASPCASRIFRGTDVK